MSTDLRAIVSHAKYLNSAPKQPPQSPKTPPNFELKNAPKNTPHHPRHRNTLFARTSSKIALEFKSRRGSRKALSSQSLGIVKKRVDPLTKGGCDEVDYTVAFTPKGGCLLKRGVRRRDAPRLHTGSIHPQGWVLVEPPVVGEPTFAPTSGRDGTVGRTAVRPYKRVFTTRGAC